MSEPTLSAYVEHFRARVLQDALSEAMADHWRRRAAQFEWARPKPEDFRGAATRADLTARDRRLSELAQNCRHHARLLDEHPLIELADLVSVLRECA